MFFSIGSDYLALEDGFEYEVTLRPSNEDDDLDDNANDVTTKPETNDNDEENIDIDLVEDEVRSVKKDQWMMKADKTDDVSRRMSARKRTFRGKTKFKVSF